MKKSVVIIVTIIIFVIIIFIALLVVNIVNGSRISGMCIKIFNEFHKVALNKRNLLRNTDFFCISVSRSSMTLMNKQEIFKVVKDKIGDKTVTIYDNNIPKTILFRDILKYVESPDDINAINIEKGFNEALNKLGVTLVVLPDEKH